MPLSLILGGPKVYLHTLFKLKKTPEGYKFWCAPLHACSQVHAGGHIMLALSKQHARKRCSDGASTIRHQCHEQQCSAGTSRITLWSPNLCCACLVMLHLHV